MDTFGPMAVLACLGCVAAKWILAMQAEGVGRDVDREREMCRAAKTQMVSASNQLRLLVVEFKQLTRKGKGLRRKIKAHEESLKKYLEMEAQEKTKIVKQEQLLEMSSAKKGTKA